ncbi:MAG: flagellar biosynthesis protein FlgN [Campylobacter sp.]|nr:flagellar biosynthesis protein FlgN [Campylobacter sp.]
MLNQYLSKALEILDLLIDLTEKDIDNIQNARHSLVDESVKKKNNLVKEFEQTKKALDKELLRISKLDSSKELSQMLDADVKSKLVIMREKLEILNKKNREYAKHVLTVKEYFDTLAKKVFKQEDGEYNSSGYII